MSLILVGGTGGLGMEIAKGLVKAKGYTSHKAIVRDSTKGKVLQDLGWTLIEVNDYFDTSSLQNAMAGAKTVVSTFGGNDIVKLDIATVHAAKYVGAQLFVPSQFGVDYRRWSNTNPYIHAKRQVVDVAKEVGLPTLNVAVGYFSDWVFDMIANPKDGTARIVGDGSAYISFTRRSDIGKVLALALDDPVLFQEAKSQQNTTLSIAGETIPYKDAIATLGKVMKKDFVIEYLDPMDALQQEQELLEKGLQGDVGAFWASFVLHLLGEPARGNTGCDNRADAKNYGITLETLEETLQSIYGGV